METGRIRRGWKEQDLPILSETAAAPSSEEPQADILTPPTMGEVITGRRVSYMEGILALTAIGSVGVLAHAATEGKIGLGLAAAGVLIVAALISNIRGMVTDPDQIWKEVKRPHLFGLIRF